MPSPFFARTQTLSEALASASRVCVTAEGRGRQTGEELGVLGSNPSSDIHFLDGPGEL